MTYNRLHKLNRNKPDYRLIFLGVIILAVAISFGIFFIKRHRAPAAPNPIEQVGPNQVKVSELAKQNLAIAKVAQVQIPAQLDIMGKISIPENGTTVVSARVSGRVDSVYVTTGEPVKIGQLLAKVYSPDFASIREEYLQAAKRKNEGDFSSLYHMSYKKLQNLGLTKEDIAELPTSDANLIHIHSPAHGVIIDKKAPLGTAINAGDPLFIISDLSKVWFLGDVYPEDLKKIHRNQDVIIDSPSGDKPIHGQVSFISPVVDPNTRTIKIRVLMNNENLALRGDMYVQAHLILSSNNAISVPTTALWDENGKNYLFKQAGQEDVFEKVEVEVGANIQNRTVINKGLTPEDTIITEGGLLLNSALRSER